MKKLINFIQNVLMINETVPQSIGLSQFKTPVTIQDSSNVSIRTKDIKLSDLMRRN